MTGSGRNFQYNNIQIIKNMTSFVLKTLITTLIDREFFKNKAIKIEQQQVQNIKLALSFPQSHTNNNHENVCQKLNPTFYYYKNDDNKDCEFNFN